MSNGRGAISLPFLAFPCLSLPFRAFPSLPFPCLSFPFLSLALCFQKHIRVFFPPKPLQGISFEEFCSLFNFPDQKYPIHSFYSIPSILMGVIMNALDPIQGVMIRGREGGRGTDHYTLDGVGGIPIFTRLVSNEIGPLDITLRNFLP